MMNANSDKVMEELMEQIEKMRLTRDDVILEAECLEEYDEYIHLSLMGYSVEILRKAADLMEYKE